MSLLPQIKATLEQIRAAQNLPPVAQIQDTEALKLAVREGLICERLATRQLVAWGLHPGDSVPGGYAALSRGHAEGHRWVLVDYPDGQHIYEAGDASGLPYVERSNSKAPMPPIVSWATFESLWCQADWQAGGLG